MKLLIIYHCGLSDSAKSFYSEYVKAGVNLSVVVPLKIIGGEGYAPEGFAYDPKSNEKRYNIFPVELRKPASYGEGFKIFQLFSAIKKVKPDVIHVHDEYSSFYLTQVIICRNILYGKKVPIVCYAAQNIQYKILPPPFVFDSLRHFLKRTLRKIIQPMALFFNEKYLNGVIGTSTEALEIIKKIGAKMPLRRIFLGE